MNVRWIRGCSTVPHVAASLGICFFTTSFFDNRSVFNELGSSWLSQPWLVSHPLLPWWSALPSLRFLLTHSFHLHVDGLCSHCREGLPVLIPFAVVDDDMVASSVPCGHYERHNGRRLDQFSSVPRVCSRSFLSHGASIGERRGDHEAPFFLLFPNLFRVPLFGFLTWICGSLVGVLTFNLWLVLWRALSNFSGEYPFPAL